MDTIYGEIVKWSQDESRPIWLRDALRRLVTKGSLGPEDEKELASICMAEFGLEPPTPVEPVPLSVDDVPTNTGLKGPVALIQTSELKGINQISGSAVLKFGQKGLSIVYGDNGAGKSGYIRLLKKVCRSRGRDAKILANVYAPEDAQEANITFTEGEEITTFTWTEDSVSPAPLSAISIFDTECALVHVDGKNDLAYQPFGLDILSRLASIAAALNTSFREEFSRSETLKERFVEFTQGTTTQTYLTTMGPLVPEEELEARLVFTPENKVELEALQKQLADFRGNDPAKKIAALSAQIRRLTELASHLTRLKEVYTDETFTMLGSLIAQEREANEAMALATKEFQTIASVSGTGTHAWKTLWEAARAFHLQHAYPTKSFPVDEEVKCVLCQQELAPEAKERMQSFEQFVKNEIQRRHQIAKAALEQQVLAMSPESRPANLETVLDELKEDTELHKEVSEFLDLATGLKATIASLLGGNCTLCSFEFSDAPLKTISDGLITGLQKDLDALNQLQSGQASTASMEQRITELKDMEKGVEAIDRAKAELKRLKRQKKLTECIRATDTTSITRKATDLAEVVTDDLKNKFAEEVSKIDSGKRLSIELRVAEGRRGATYHEIVLSSAQTQAPLSSVLSEGEHRAIALAAFLTEISVAPTPSGIIFDDPVSSLDHKRRERIAQRLVTEAGVRQVVVFTHDLRFAFDLMNHAEKQGVEPLCLTTFAGHDGTGLVHDGLPWDGMNTEQRLRSLRNQLQEITALYKANDIENYRRGAKDFYTQLRETWERAVEMNLLNETVTRFGRDVQTKRLSKLIDITEADTIRVSEGMERASCFAHDAAMEGAPELPEPDALSADLENLDEWVRSIKDRRK